MRNPPTKEKQNYKESNIRKYKVKTSKLSSYTNPLGLHTANQSSCNTLREIPLKTLEQKAQREARKRIESQRFSKFLALF